MSGWLDFGHPHATDGDFFSSHGMSQEDPAAETLHMNEPDARLRNAPSVDDARWGLPSPNGGATSTAKTISMQMAAGMIVGVLAGTIVVSGVLMKSKSLGFKSNMNRNSLAVRSSAVAGAIAVPAYLYAMNR